MYQESNRYGDSEYMLRIDVPYICGIFVGEHGGPCAPVRFDVSYKNIFLVSNGICERGDRTIDI